MSGEPSVETAPPTETNAPPTPVAPASQIGMSWADMSDEEDDLAPVVQGPKSQLYQPPRSHPTEQYSDQRRHGGRNYRDNDRRHNRDRDMGRRGGGGGGGSRGGAGGGRHRDTAPWETRGTGSRERRDAGFQRGGSADMNFKPGPMSYSQSTINLSSSGMTKPLGGASSAPRFNLSQIKTVLNAGNEESRNSKIFGDAKPREEVVKPERPPVEILAPPSGQHTTLIQEQDHSRSVPSNPLRAYNTTDNGSRSSGRTTEVESFSGPSSNNFAPRTLLCRKPDLPVNQPPSSDSAGPMNPFPSQQPVLPSSVTMYAMHVDDLHKPIGNGEIHSIPMDPNAPMYHMPCNSQFEGPRRTPPSSFLPISPGEHYNRNPYNSDSEVIPQEQYDQGCMDGRNTVCSLNMQLSNGKVPLDGMSSDNGVIFQSSSAKGAYEQDTSRCLVFGETVGALLTRPPESQRRQNSSDNSTSGSQCQLSTTAVLGSPRSTVTDVPPSTSAPTQPPPPTPTHPVAKPQSDKPAAWARPPDQVVTMPSRNGKSQGGARSQENLNQTSRARPSDSVEPLGGTVEKPTELPKRSGTTGFEDGSRKQGFTGRGKNNRGGKPGGAVGGNVPRTNSIGSNMSVSNRKTDSANQNANSTSKAPTGTGGEFSSRSSTLNQKPKSYASVVKHETAAKADS